MKNQISINTLSHKVKHSFTLIEILIVIAIIGVLAATIIASTGAARQQARDTRRTQDLDALKTALGLYYNDQKKYPYGYSLDSLHSDIGFCIEKATGLQSLLVNNGYISQIPKDPKYNESLCNNPYDSGCYCYIYKTKGNQMFKIFTKIEQSNFAPAQKDGGTESALYEVYSLSSGSNKIAFTGTGYTEPGGTPIVYAGTTNKLAKFTSSTELGDSLIFDNGTNVGVGTTSPGAKLDVNGLVKSKTGYLDRNMLDTTIWSTSVGSGIGGVGSFGQNGAAAENGRVWSTDPFGRPSLVWESINDAASDADGGWNYNNVPIDNNKAYRLSVWIKKVGTTSGSIYLGCDGGNTLNLNNTANTNPYFFSFGSSTLVSGRWYLLVGYIHANNDSSTASYSAVYDGVTGKKVRTGTDFKNRGATNYQTHRTYNYYDTVAGSIQYFWGPRFEEINGFEPSIESLLGISQGATNEVDSYFGGNVGIGTTSPGAKLEVNGNVKINTGGSANKVICWKSDGKTLGYCSTVPDSTGACTCN